MSNGTNKAAIIYSMLDNIQQQQVLAMFNENEKQQIISASTAIDNVDQTTKNDIYNEFINLIKNSTL